jgi:hypothetical protein
VSVVRSIPVQDANGDQLTVYELQDRRFIRRTRRLQLCTGELVHSLNDDTFQLPSGELLQRLR